MGRRAGKRVSLVLGSGGARGLAHIGVIQCLEEQGYHIESIAGASMGALVGGIHAAGELAAYRDWVCALSRTDVLRFLDFAFSAGGLFKGDRIMDTLRDMVGEHAIEDLPIAYTAVATDIDRQREVWISRGPLFDAIRASIAVPTVFTPHRYLGLTLVDGGLLDPVPIAPTFRDRTDLTIAVNLNGGDRAPRGPERGQDRDPAVTPKDDLVLTHPPVSGRHRGRLDAGRVDRPGGLRAGEPLLRDHAECHRRPEARGLCPGCSDRDPPGLLRGP